MNKQILKQISIIFLFTTTSFYSLSQTGFRKWYKVPTKIYFSSSDKQIRKETSFNDSLKKKGNHTIMHLRIEDSTKRNPIATENNIFNSTFGKKKKFKANVKFEKNKLFVNPWYVNDSLRKMNYFFELKNRQSIKLSYQQITFTTLTIPVRVQFGREDKVAYSTGISIGAMLGYTWGESHFTHRSKLDNFKADQFFTLGVLANVTSIEFNNRIGAKRKTASLDLGIGAVYGYRNINFGLCFGYSLGMGQDSKDWDFNSRPWLGIMVGYSLFGS